jgi:hypothetical protein
VVLHYIHLHVWVAEAISEHCQAFRIGEGSKIIQSLSDEGLRIKEGKDTGIGEGNSIEIGERSQSRVTAFTGDKRNSVHTIMMMRFQGLESIAVQGERGVTGMDGRGDRIGMCALLGDGNR